MIGGAIAAAVLIAVIVIVLALTLSANGAPDVVGLSLDQARQLAADAGMQVEVTAQIPSFDKAAGTVLEQAPDPGIESDDDVLRLTVTREPTPVTVTEIKDYDPEGDQTENPDAAPQSHRRQGQHELVHRALQVGLLRQSQGRSRTGVHSRRARDHHGDRLHGGRLEGRVAPGRVLGIGGQHRHPRRERQPDHHPSRAARAPAGSGSPSWPRSRTGVGAWSCRRSASTSSRRDGAARRRDGRATSRRAQLTVKRPMPDHHVPVTTRATTHHDQGEEHPVGRR